MHADARCGGQWEGHQAVMSLNGGAGIKDHAGQALLDHAVHVFGQFVSEPSGTGRSGESWACRPAFTSRLQVNEKPRELAVDSAR